MPNSAPVISGPSFSQSSAIAFSILIGFVVFITCRGHLGAYFAVFLGTGGAGDNPGAASTLSPTLTLGSVIQGVTEPDAATSTEPNNPPDLSDYGSGDPAAAASTEPNNMPDLSYYGSGDPADANPPAGQMDEALPASEYPDLPELPEEIPVAGEL